MKDPFELTLRLPQATLRPFLNGILKLAAILLKLFILVGLRDYMGLIIRSSDIHAAGCYTTSKIREGARVIEYTGPRITKEEGDRLYENSPVTYLFGLEDGETVIDGHGMAMFINHSCDPNCETEEIDGRVWISAIRDIEPGEELTYDYLLYDGDDEAPCYCGSPNCRGTMYAPPQDDEEEDVEGAAAAATDGPPYRYEPERVADSGAGVASGDVV